MPTITQTSQDLANAACFASQRCSVTHTTPNTQHFLRARRVFFARRASSPNARHGLDNPSRYIDPSGHWAIPSFDQLLGGIKNAIAWVVTTGAEFAHKGYSLGDNIAKDHPAVVNYSNIIVDASDKLAERFVDTNPDTASWSDIGFIWLFEIGGSNEMKFGPEAATTKEVMKEEGVQNTRDVVLGRISNGDLRPGEVSWTYGQKEFYDGVKTGNKASSFLGSYTTYFDILKNDDGSYTVNYKVKNPSTWESATRLRKAKEPGGLHQGIIPNKPRNAGIHLGGDFSQEWYWSEVINP